MKHLTHRALALLLALALCISMLPGMAIAATVEYVTGTVMDKDGEKVLDDSVIKNWGVRGETATFLSPNAVAFYEKNDVTYSALAALTGSGDFKTLPESELYKALNELMVANHANQTSYDDTRTMYSYTDCQKSGEIALTCFYSGKNDGIADEWDSGATWNREHVLPQSKSVDDRREDDIMVLRPLDKSLNSSRGNKAYGEGDTAKYYNPLVPSNGVYDVRGDVARVFLYDCVRWGTELVFPNAEGGYKENTTTGTMVWGELGVFESKEILLKWMTEDPVDTWEMGRNDSVESITGTRNVFVDYPELAYTLLGEEVPADLTSPSGEGFVTEYSVSATTNNSSYGSFHINGYTITATPVAGYELTDASIVSGTGSIACNGNTITVTPESDCTVALIFTQKDAVTVTYYENGAVGGNVTTAKGEAVVLPGQTVAVEGFTFVGWLETELSQTTEKPEFLKAGDKYTVNGDTILYALYSREDADAEGAEVYKLVESADQLKVNSNIVIAGATVNKALSTNQKSNNRGAANITKDAATKTATLSADVEVLKLVEGTVSGTYAFCIQTGSNSGKYLYAAGKTSNNYLRTGSLAANASFKITVNTDGSCSIEAQDSATTRNKLFYNTSDLFACYEALSNQTKPVCLYIGTTEGATYYSTGDEPCAHTNTTTVPAQAPTCTEIGYTAGIYCNDCQSYPQGHERLEATGHKWDDGVVTEATWETQGFTTYTCANCGETDKKDYTDALQWVHTITFRVPEGVAPVADITSTDNGFIMPAAGDIEGYTFMGWVEEVVEDATEAPDITKAGDKHDKVQKAKTFHALYSYVVGGSEVSYQLVTSADQLEIGKSVIIAAKGSNFAMGVGSSNGNNRTQADIKKSGTTLSYDANTVIFTLGEGTKADTYTFNDGAGYLYAASSSSNHLKTTAQADDNASFAITVNADGVATVKAQGKNTRNWMRYNSSSKIFACYSSGQQDICLYILTGDAGTTYYTTLTAPAGCEHDYADNGLCRKCELVGDGEQNYASLAEAIEVSGAEYLYLNFDLTEDVTVESDIVLDLNGKTLTGDIEIYTGAALYLFDSATADYTAENRGKIVGAIEGDLVRVMNTPASFGHNYKYLTIEEEDGVYSAHRVYLSVKSVSLAPCINNDGEKESAISYKTVFKCSDFVADYVSDYGIKVTGDNAVDKSFGIDVAGGENWATLRLDGTLSTANSAEVNAANAAAKVAVSACITLEDGTQLVSAAVTKSLEDLVIYANGVEGLTELQMKALGRMYTYFADVMEGWDIENIKSYAAN